MKRLHITGCPRSGTTLLFELMATCFEIDSKCDHEESIFTPVGAHGGLHLSKQPTDIMHIDKLLNLDKNLFVLNICRDPRAVITSKHWSMDQYFVNYRVWKECDRAARDLYSHKRFLQVHYEKLISYPDIYQKMIQDKFAFLKQLHRFSQYHLYARPDRHATLAMNGLRALAQDSLLKWKKHLPRVKSQLLLYPEMQEDLIYHNYEEDRGWQRLLTNVEPVSYPCRYPERKNVLRKIEKKLRLKKKTAGYKCLSKRHSR